MSKSKRNAADKILATQLAPAKLRAAKDALKSVAAPVTITIGKSKPMVTQPVVHAAKVKPNTTAVTESTSKLDIIITMLKSSEGATLEELVEATGWQRHSLHGTMSGVLKKRLGLPIVTEYGERGRMYSIADAQ